MKPIKTQSPVQVHPAAINPEFGELRILCEDPWSYVELSLKRKKKEQSLAYWSQAKEFLKASQQLSVQAAPLPLYYCFLNAAKALLSFQNLLGSEKHGVSGKQLNEAQNNLQNEIIKFPSSGVAADLSKYLGTNPSGSTSTLKDILGTLPFLHRAFQITFKSERERFIPLKSADYFCNDDSTKRFFSAEPYGRFQDARTLPSLPQNFEHFEYEGTRYIRRKKNTDWGINQNSKDEDVTSINKKFIEYHRHTRLDLMYIAGPENLWYLRKPRGDKLDKIHSLVLMFAAMHRLSELSRYDPLGFNKLLNTQANWLLTEFVSLAPSQFVYEIATELTGRLFSLPRIRGAYV